MTAALDQHAADAIGAPPERLADFARPLVCILGLPFDAIDVRQAVERIRHAAFNNRRCFVSTPNLNFAIAARRDAVFRSSVLRSDLSLVDGMPLVWIARLLKLPVPERVSGADVFEALQAHPGPPVTVYLFGGPPGAAARACEGINRRGGGVQCVGYHAAGFGSVESMSGSELIAHINGSGAHFVVVSLGAVKGQAWIEHNASRLTAPVLSHLGAVVNFAAGTLTRAPRWVRSFGLEWLWRVKEEPGLWRRYFNDGLAAAGLLLTHVLPDALEARGWLAYGPRSRSHPAPHLESIHAPNGHTLHLHGDWRGEVGTPALRAALADCAAGEAAVTIDLTGVAAIGNTVTALMLVARGWFAGRSGCAVTGATGDVLAQLRRRLAADALLGAD
jgi:N-acetylglucosaminyldiphosphoundecaprenol N-acetyl-beta-D-mannosaminyltransferase